MQDYHFSQVAEQFKNPWARRLFYLPICFSHSFDMLSKIKSRLSHNLVSIFPGGGRTGKIVVIEVMTGGSAYAVARGL